MKPRPIWVDVALLAGILFGLYSFIRQPDSWAQIKSLFQ
jgi:hypothetical protein